MNNISNIELGDIALEGIVIPDEYNIQHIDTVSPNNIFLHRIYDYYYRKGFDKILTERIKSLLIHYFLLFFILFLTNCIDYKAIYYFDDNSNGNTHITEFININNWFPKNLYFKLCLITYLIYIICHSINTIVSIRNAWGIRKIYIEKLGINHNEFDKYKWNDIVQKIIDKYPDPNLQINTINSRICIKDNIIINFLRSKLIEFPVSSVILEWNMIYCFINSLFDKDSNETKITDISLNEYIKKVKSRLIIVFIINLISLPFTLYIFFIYTLINYGEKIYNDTDLLTNRICAISGYWRMRYYNELPHHYDERQDYITKEVNKLLSVRRYTVLNIILKLINFVLASIFITIIIISLLNEKMLTESYIYGNRSLLWGLGIITTLILLIRKNTMIHKMNNDERKFHLEKLSKKIRSLYPDYFNGERETWNDFIKLFSTIYQYQINFIILELMYIILSPWYIYKWYTKFDYELADKIKTMITSNYIMGYVCERSVFTNYNLIKKDPHLYYSVIEFYKKNPEWKPIINIMVNENIDSIYGNTFDWQKYLETFNKNNNINFNNLDQNIEGVGLMDTIIDTELLSSYI